MLVYLEGPDLPSRSWDSLAPRLQVRNPGWLNLGEHLLGVVPRPGEPDPVDAAINGARALLRSPQEAVLPTLSELRIVLLPGEIVVGKEGTETGDEPIVRSLRELPSTPFGPGIHLTSRLASVAPEDWRFGSESSWQMPTGPEIPFLRLTGWRSESRYPWHNRTLLGTEIPYRPRPELEEHLRDSLDQELLRLTGQIGVGKSRTLCRVLEAGPTRALWAAAGRRGLSVAEQWLERMLTTGSSDDADRMLERLRKTRDEEGRAELAADTLIERLGSGVGSPPPVLVGDDWQDRLPRDDELLGKLREAGIGARLRIVLIGRTDVEWPDAATGPVVEIPPWSRELLEDQAKGLTEGLEMPDSVRERFVDAAAGSPLSLEEGLLALIHRRLLRRVYGSFFFAGDENTEFLPSPLLAAHFLAESDRLGTTWPLSTLAAAGHPTPSAILTRVAATEGRRPDPDWLARAARAGWSKPVETPWGPGAAFVDPGLEATLRGSLTEETDRLLRRTLGKTLRDREVPPVARWQVYELLQDTEEAASALLEAIPRRGIPKGEDPETVVAALRTELRDLRERDGSPDEELELLWSLLPLARRLGRLQEVDRELARARELSRGEPNRELAVATLQAELEEKAGKPRRAEGHLHRALALAVEQNHRSKPLLTLHLGRVLAREERYEEARQLLEKLLPRLEEAGAAKLAATCRFHLGNVALHQRRFEDAMLLHHRALDARRDQNRPGPIRASLCALGKTALQRGDYREALKRFRQALEALSDRDDESLDRSIALMGLGTVLFRLGRYSEATVPLREAARLRSLHGSSLGEALCRVILAELFLELEQLEPAQEAARQALFRLSLAEDTGALGDAERVLGRVLMRRNDLEAARRHLRRAEKIHGEHGMEAAVVEDLGWQVVEALEREDRETVEVLVRRLEEALEEGSSPARGEIVDHQLFTALEWLEDLGSKVPSPPLRFLRRSYRELLRKTSYLDPDQRAHFLTQVRPHQQILEDATRYGLSLPALV